MVFCYDSTGMFIPSNAVLQGVRAVKVRNTIPAATCVSTSFARRATSPILLVGFLGDKLPVHDALHRGVNEGADAREAMYPSWDPANAQAPAEVVGEMTAISSEKAIVVAGVFLDQLRQQLRDFLGRKFRAPQLDGLPEIVIRVRLWLDARHATHRLGDCHSKGPLEASDFDTCVENAAELQRRARVCEDAVQLPNAVLLRHVVNVKQHWQTNANRSRRFPASQRPSEDETLRGFATRHVIQLQVRVPPRLVLPHDGVLEPRHHRCAKVLQAKCVPVLACDTGLQRLPEVWCLGHFGGAANGLCQVGGGDRSCAACLIGRSCDLEQSQDPITDCLQFHTEALVGDGLLANQACDDARGFAERRPEVEKMQSPCAHPQ
mmetsp:Transcript_109806/g.309603  ORF Transcript_109806/g.309603 Transcript_109806/m.309603 type:complete len:377 (-) Transcript_109806:406-1536(-)